MVSPASGHFSVAFSRKPFSKDDSDEQIHSPGLEQERENISLQTVYDFFSKHYRTLETALPNFANRLTFSGEIEKLEHRKISSICLALDNLAICFGRMKALAAIAKENCCSEEEEEKLPQQIAESHEDFWSAVLRLKKATRDGIQVEYSFSEIPE